MASITVNGKEYIFKRFNEIGVNKRAQKFLRNAAFNDVAKVEADEDTPEWKEAAGDWLKFCAIIFEPPRQIFFLRWLTWIRLEWFTLARYYNWKDNWCERDENLQLGNLTFETYTEILTGFFGTAETKTPP